MKTNEGTDRPGSRIPPEEAEKLIRVFLARFRPLISPSRPSNLPTACVLNGKNLTEPFCWESLVGFDQVLILFEQLNELRSVSAQQIEKYLESKEPWEDYDICIFDHSLNWCIGISHEDRVTIVGDRS